LCSCNTLKQTIPDGSIALCVILIFNMTTTFLNFVLSCASGGQAKENLQSSGSFSRAAVVPGIRVARMQ
jgi:hypothetical protein